MFWKAALSWATKATIAFLGLLAILNAHDRWSVVVFGALLYFAWEASKMYTAAINQISRLHDRIESLETKIQALHNTLR